MNQASRWLAQVMAGQEPDWALASQVGFDALLREARLHDVVAFVDWRLQQAQGGDAALSDLFSQAAKPQVLASMVQEAELRRVLVAMQTLGLDGLLLKGTALAFWAYPLPHLRACSDLDVLLASYADGRALASKLCADAGYVQSSPGEDMGYEFTCRKQVAPGVDLELDLHWQLVNAPLFAQVFSYDELVRSARPIPALGSAARGLHPVHALVHACLHRAANVASERQDTLKWLYDICILACQLSEMDRAQLLATCERKQVVRVCGAALQAAQTYWPGTKLDPVLDMLGKSSTPDAFDAADLLDWHHAQKLNFQALPTWGARLLWLKERICPSKTYLRAIYGLPQAGYGRLMWIRIGRFVRRCLK
jgi:hypothetical protein